MPTAASPLQEIVSVFGQPVAGNPTQYMMEKAFVHHGLDWRYLTVEVAPESLGDAVRGMRAMGFRGGNLTTPHKVAVIEFLDRLTEPASLMGAVNCILREGDELVGDNTDGRGFLKSLREITDPKDQRVVVLGAGGAARAIVVEVALAGAAHITIVNRSEDRGSQLVDALADKLSTQLEFVLWHGDFQVPAEASILIQATSIGLGDDEARVSVALESFRGDLLVADVIPNPPDTRLLRDARQRGCTTIDGLGMLVNQALINFRLWTGHDADAAVMRDALEEFLEV